MGASSASSRSSTTPLAYTLQQFCEQIGVSRSLVYKLIKAGKIRSIRVAGRRLIPVAEAERIVREGAI